MKKINIKNSFGRVRLQLEKGGIRNRCLDISKQRLLKFSFYFIGRKNWIRLNKKFSPILIVIEDENERIYFYPKNWVGGSKI
jgi:hypothetical protein